ncbi:MAG: hypothetical protein LC637_04870, partial [Xanthomonadaceae bacterium]|nr:hypothetical protein [Xanthomonadaceae bacterium]
MRLIPGKAVKSNAVTRRNRRPAAGILVLMLCGLSQSAFCQYMPISFSVIYEHAEIIVRARILDKAAGRFEYDFRQPDGSISIQDDIFTKYTFESVELIKNSTKLNPTHFFVPGGEVDGEKVWWTHTSTFDPGMEIILTLWRDRQSGIISDDMLWLSASGLYRVINVDGSELLVPYRDSRNLISVDNIPRTADGVRTADIKSPS